MFTGRENARWLPWTLFAAAALYFAHHSLASQSGLGAYARNEERIAVLSEQAAALGVERRRLDQRVALLNPNAVDPDFADELVRRSLGFSRSDEIVIPLRNADLRD